jgi:DNA-directed RNA polymerase specialized sigma24 family protein
MVTGISSWKFVLLFCSWIVMMVWRNRVHLEVREPIMGELAVDEIIESLPIIRGWLPGADGDDLAQQVMLEVFTKARGGRNLSKRETLLTAKRRLIDRCRQNKRRPEPLEESKLLDTEAHQPSDVVGQLEIETRVQQELGRLDTNLHLIITCYIEGKPDKSTAKQLGMSVSNLRKKRYKLFQLLSRRLRPLIANP